MNSQERVYVLPLWQETEIFEVTDEAAWLDVVRMMASACGSRVPNWTRPNSLWRYFYKPKMPARFAKFIGNEIIWNGIQEEIHDAQLQNVADCYIWHLCPLVWPVGHPEREDETKTKYK